MKRIIYLMAGMILAVSCNPSNQGYSVKVNIDDSGAQYIRLLSAEGRDFVVFDSVLAVPGEYVEMSGQVEGVKTMYLTLENSDGSVQLLMENANYDISGSLEAPVIKTDSKAQDDLNGYNDGKKPISEQMQATRAAIIESRNSDDTERADSLRGAYYELYDRQDRYDSVYVVEHPDSYASVLALRGTFYLLDANGLEEALSSLDASVRVLEEYQYMKGKLEKMKKVAVGMPYTDFGLMTPEGEMVKVSDVHQGQVLLIDFWASWCGPCRRANPELVEIYNEFHPQGFEILGVSLDRDSASWVKAIADDQLTWFHISDLKYWESEGAVLYGVPAIPHGVLINRDGIITAKNLEGDELRQAIESLVQSD